MVFERELSILHLDDDEEDHEIFKAALLQVAPRARLSYVTSLPSLLRELFKDPLPDIVFLDLDIPIGHEKSYVREIRSIERFKNLPVVVHSAHTHAEILKACHEDGANLYILKQANFGILKRMIYAALVRDLVKPTSLEEFVLNVE